METLFLNYDGNLLHPKFIFFIIQVSILFFIGSYITTYIKRFSSNIFYYIRFKQNSNLKLGSEIEIAVGGVGMFRGKIHDLSIHRVYIQSINNEKLLSMSISDFMTQQIIYIKK